MVDKKTSPPFQRRSDIVRKSLSEKPFHGSNESYEMHEGTQRPRRERRNQQTKS